MKRRPLALLAFLLLVLSAAVGQSGGELRFYLHSEPKTFDPLLVADDASETIRYLTGGVLVRVNRRTQQAEPELAASWTISRDGRSITFNLRERVYYSDGTPFSAEDVAYTVQRLMDPALHSPTGDSFRSGSGVVRTRVDSPARITITFPAPVAGIDKLFDQVAIVSSRSANKERAVLGPFYVADYKPDSYVLLKRNPNYWRRDATGRQLPYLDAVRLGIQPNRDIEMMNFRRGEIDLINWLDSEYFDRLAGLAPEVVHDAGPGLESEQMWFNQFPNAPIPAYKREWFRSTHFRRAISGAINRADLARVVYGGHAQPAAGPVSPANKFWFNAKLRTPAYDPAGALSLLQQAGFRLEGTSLRDREGHAVEFSIITNAGNKARERMATMIQQDLGKIGITVHVVTLDFASLIDRITESYNYEGALLGTANTDLDPNAQMNMWLSSAENHQWNPRQKSPETAWEAEIDRLMKEQASSLEPAKRKACFDRVQEIVVEQQPFSYLVNKNALSAVATTVANASPVVLRPQTYWNAETLSVRVQTASKH
ncbi:MAG TPA: ABC transporter substrate-binding protein [Terriglobales bacterium]|nr:ABC transporter substrate-binding protein [Terriglobales bacterium]